MSEMVERVARALAKADRIEICSDASYAFSSYGPKARAAIEEMREPTHAMKVAGSMEIDNFLSPSGPVWQAMITAALILF